MTIFSSHLCFWTWPRKNLPLGIDRVFHLSVSVARKPCFKLSPKLVPLFSGDIVDTLHHDAYAYSSSVTPMPDPKAIPSPHVVSAVSGANSTPDVPSPIPSEVMVGTTREQFVAIGYWLFPVLFSGYTASPPRILFFQRIL